MVETARYARENGIPYFGLCLGLQVMVIEYARNVLGLNDANSSEMDEQCRDQVVHIMPDQIDLTEKGGTMRLGDYPCSLLEGTQAHRAYGSVLVSERHRHRYELNNSYRESLENAGLMASRLSPDGNLVEISEVEGHPFMIGTQFHPEFRSRPNRPHPLFRDFVGSTLDILRDGSQSSLPLEHV